LYWQPSSTELGREGLQGIFGQNLSLIGPGMFDTTVRHNRSSSWGGINPFNDLVRFRNASV
jgi:hypothetical protein